MYWRKKKKTVNSEKLKHWVKFEMYKLKRVSQINIKMQPNQRESFPFLSNLIFLSIDKIAKI